MPHYILDKKSRRNRKAENKYQKKQAQKYLEARRFETEPSPSDGFTKTGLYSAQSKNSSRHFSRLLFMLLFFTVIRYGMAEKTLPQKMSCSNPKDKGCTDGKTQLQNNANFKYDIIEKVKIRVEPGIKGVDCAYLKDSLKRISTQLRDRVDRIDRVLKQENFQFACIAKEDLATIRNAKAYYEAFFNYIGYPAKNSNMKVEDKSLDTDLDHELIHADTSLRHKTFYCNIGFFSKKQVSDLVKTYGLDKSQLQYLTVFPFWPPTKESMEKFERILKKDADLGKIEDLIRLHKKNYKQTTMTQDEKERYERYRKSLKNTLPINREVYIHDEFYPELQSYIDQHGSLPKEIMLSNGMIYSIKESALTKDYFDFNATIKPEDEISNFLYQYYFIKNQYGPEQIKKMVKEKGDTEQINNFVKGKFLAESDTHYRTGIPDSGVQEFFPNLYEHLKKEEACCFEGKASGCGL